MKKIGMLFFMACLMSTGRVGAAVLEHHEALKAKPAEVPRSILAEAGVGTEEAGLKIFNGAKTDSIRRMVRSGITRMGKYIQVF